MNLVRLQPKGGGEEGYVHTELSIILSDSELVGNYYAIFLINENGTKKQVIPKTGTKIFTGNDKVIIESLGNYVIKYGADASLDRETAYSLKEIKATDTVTISSVSFYSEWLETAEIDDSTYPTLSDLLQEGVQNEYDVRKLFTLHASVDKLIEWYNDNPSDFPLDEFLSCRIAVKWIGLRDYACDKLFEIEAVKTALINNNTEFTVDGTTKYAWEYILKDCVPQMIANNMPYGNVTQSNSFSDVHLGYKAFNRKNDVNEDRWVTRSNSSGHDWLQYDFANPISLYRVDIQPFSTANHVNDVKLNSDILIQVKLNGSDEWSLFGTVHQLETEERYKVHEIYTDKPKLIKSVRLQFQTVNLVNRGAYYCGIANANFFGRSLNENVPCATKDSNGVANGMPIGEAFCDSEYNTGGYHLTKWRAFDKSTNESNPNYSRWCNAWDHGAVWQDAYLGYKFVKPICVKSFKVIPFFEYNTLALKDFIIRGWNSDSDYWDSEIFHFDNVAGERILPLNNNKAFTHWYLIVKSESYYSRNTNGICIYELDFFGVDYSEKELEQDSNMKYIYDNGIEFDELYLVNSSKKSSCINIGNSRGGTIPSFFTTLNEIDLSKFKMAFARTGEHFYNSQRNEVAIVVCSTKEWSTYIGYRDCSPTELYFNIENYSNNHIGIGWGATATYDIDITEFWLE